MGARCERISLESFQAEQRKQRYLSSNPLKLPVQRFVVEAKNAPVRLSPSDEALVCGGYKRGDEVEAVEERFDGWVKVLPEGGWVRQHTAKHRRILQPLAGDDAALKVVPLAASARSSQTLEVVATCGATVRAEPRDDAPQREVRRCGDTMAAEAQSFHGWVRLADNGGWCSGFAADGAALLRALD